MTKETFKILMRHVIDRLLCGNATVAQLVNIDPEIDATVTVRFLKNFDAYVREKSNLISPYIFLVKDSDDLMNDVTHRLWLRLMTPEDKAEIHKLFDSYIKDLTILKLTQAEHYRTQE